MKSAFLLSENYTGRVMLRYFSMNVEGILYLEISKELREQILLLNTIGAISRDRINGYNSSVAFISESAKFILFAPDYRITDFSQDIDFGISYNTGKNLWHVKSIIDENIEPDKIVQCEALFIEVGKDRDWWITLLPYENKYFCTRAFTIKVKLSDIGL